MEINETIVIQKPKKAREGSVRVDAFWTHKAILRATWELRRKIMKEKGVDIFQVYEMSDCIEVHIEGDIVTIPADTYSQRLKKRRRFHRK